MTKHELMRENQMLTELEEARDTILALRKRLAAIHRYATEHFPGSGVLEQIARMAEELL